MTDQQSSKSDDGGKRVIALTLAVIHHGLSNFASATVPPGWMTVLDTADKFRDWLDGKTPNLERSRRRR